MSYQYPQDMYRNYAKSIYLEVDKKLGEVEAMSPSGFAALYRFEVTKAMKRMIQVTGTLRRVSECPDLQPNSTRRC